MLVDARMMFAKRVAQWMSESELSEDEMTKRISMWPSDFAEMIVEANQ